MRNIPPPTPTPVPMARILSDAECDGLSVCGWSVEVDDDPVGEAVVTSAAVDNELVVKSDVICESVDEANVVASADSETDISVDTSYGDAVVPAVVVGSIPAVAVMLGSSIVNFKNESRVQQSSEEQQYRFEFFPQRITHSPPSTLSIIYCQETNP